MTWSKLLFFQLLYSVPKRYITKSTSMSSSSSSSVERAHACVIQEVSTGHRQLVSHEFAWLQIQHLRREWPFRRCFWEDQLLIVEGQALGGPVGGLWHFFYLAINSVPNSHEEYIWNDQEFVSISFEWTVPLVASVNVIIHPIRCDGNLFLPVLGSKYFDFCLFFVTPWQDPKSSLMPPFPSLTHPNVGSPSLYKDHLWSFTHLAGLRLPQSWRPAGTGAPPWVMVFRALVLSRIFSCVAFNMAAVGACGGRGGIAGLLRCTVIVLNSL